MALPRLLPVPAETTPAVGSSKSPSEPNSPRSAENGEGLEVLEVLDASAPKPDIEEMGLLDLPPEPHTTIRWQEPKPSWFSDTDTVETFSTEDAVVEIERPSKTPPEKPPYRPKFSLTEFILANLGALPLLTGAVAALVWANVSWDSYEDWFGKHPRYHIGIFMGHEVGLYFFINDIFMCFFFGLAGKEVFDTLKPGGSLYPPRRAINPLLSTAGGVVGPAAFYVVLILILYFTGGFDSVPDVSLSDLLKGWGVPTATDIALSWVMAVRIFGDAHPAVFYLVVLAVLDDAIGIVIIAIFYPDPVHPVKPLFLSLILVAMIIAYLLRRIHCYHWTPYILIAGPVAWMGLLKAYVHPALALVFVVPFMPDDIKKDDDEADDEDGVEMLSPASKSTEKSGKSAFSMLTLHKGIRFGVDNFAGERLRKWIKPRHGPLHAFEEDLKHTVDVGLGFFTLANAGVRLSSPGTLTAAIIASLIIGKTLGIWACGMLGQSLGFRLPRGVAPRDLAIAGCIAGCGLTVALFVAAEAFPDPLLQEQAKLGALLSLLAYPVALLLNRCLPGVTDKKVLDRTPSEEEEKDPHPERWASVRVRPSCLVSQEDGLLRENSARSLVTDGSGNLQWGTPAAKDMERRHTKDSFEHATQKPLPSPQATRERRNTSKPKGRGNAARFLNFDDEEQEKRHTQAANALRADFFRAGEGVASAARRMLAVLLLEKMGGVYFAFHLWREQVKRNKANRLHKTLERSSCFISLVAMPGDSVLLEITFSLWKDAIATLKHPKERALLGHTQ